MLTIRLFCAQGMSTSLLIEKMLEAAKKQGMEVDICAYMESEIESHMDGVDVVLLGPQVAYRLDVCKPICEEKGIPIDVISMIDYGMMNGEKVLALAVSMVEKGE